MKPKSAVSPQKTQYLQTLDRRLESSVTFEVASLTVYCLKVASFVAERGSWLDEITKDLRDLDSIAVIEKEAFSRFESILVLIQDFLSKGIDGVPVMPSEFVESLFLWISMTAHSMGCHLLMWLEKTVEPIKIQIFIAA